MKRSHEKDANAARKITLAQDLTIYNAGDVKKQFLEALEALDAQDASGAPAAGKVIELDLSQVAEIDTSGIQLLILAKRESLRHKRTLRIVAHSGPVREAIDFFDLATYFGDPLLIPAREAA